MVFNRVDSMDDLFFDNIKKEQIGSHAVLFRKKLIDQEHYFYETIQAIAAEIPFHHYETRGGGRIAAAMTGCGNISWISDQYKGYRYEAFNPITKRKWPAIPKLFFDYAQECAAAGGFENFIPDSCLINRYVIGDKMGLHCDKDEKDLTAPIVSLSFGLSAPFIWGGLSRTDPKKRYMLHSGDVVVWGGESRLVYHAIGAVQKGNHPIFGPYRYNLTFRKVY